MSLFPNRETIDAIKKTCAAADVEFVGVQDGLFAAMDDRKVVLFNARSVWGTLELELEGFSVDRIRAAVTQAINSGIQSSTPRKI